MTTMLDLNRFETQQKEEDDCNHCQNRYINDPGYKDSFGLLGL